MSTDKLTSIVGLLLGVLQAGNVALGQIPAGTTMALKDWLGIAMAVGFAIIGIFTNKAGQVGIVTTPVQP